MSFSLSFYCIYWGFNYSFAPKGVCDNLERFLKTGRERGENG